MKSTVSTLALLVIFLLRPAAAAEVGDGDGFHLGTERIRLWGIDAPELDQECKRDRVAYRCGEQARDALKGLLAAGNVRCEAIDRDRYRRTVARCWADGRDLGAEMVRLGWAVDFRRYSHGFYEAEEQEARRVKRGLWAGEFISPSEWRRGHKGRHTR